MFPIIEIAEKELTLAANIQRNYIYGCAIMETTNKIDSDGKSDIFQLIAYFL